MAHKTQCWEGFMDRTGHFSLRFRVPNISSHNPITMSTASLLHPPSVGTIKSQSIARRNFPLPSSSRIAFLCFKTQSEISFKEGSISDSKLKWTTDASESLSGRESKKGSIQVCFTFIFSSHSFEYLQFYLCKKYILWRNKIKLESLENSICSILTLFPISSLRTC